CDEVFRVRGGLAIGSWSRNAPLQRLVRTYLLTEVGEHLDFSAPIIRGLYLLHRFGSTVKPSRMSITFKSFLVDVFQAIDAHVLRETLGTGQYGRILERTWQMEFYRVASQILPRGYFISPDVGAVFGSNGYLDFWVERPGETGGWAIEVL